MCLSTTLSSSSSSPLFDVTLNVTLLTYTNMTYFDGAIPATSNPNGEATIFRMVTPPSNGYFVIIPSNPNAFVYGLFNPTICNPVYCDSTGDPTASLSLGRYFNWLPLNTGGILAVGIPYFLYIINTLSFAQQLTAGFLSEYTCQPQFYVITEISGSESPNIPECGNVSETLTTIQPTVIQSNSVQIFNAIVPFDNFTSFYSMTVTLSDAVVQNGNPSLTGVFVSGLSLFGLSSNLNAMGTAGGFLGGITQTGSSSATYHFLFPGQTLLISALYLSSNSLQISFSPESEQNLQISSTNSPQLSVPSVTGSSSYGAFVVENMRLNESFILSLSSSQDLSQVLILDSTFVHVLASIQPESGATNFNFEIILPLNSTVYVLGIPSTSGQSNHLQLAFQTHFPILYADSNAGTDSVFCGWDPLFPCATIFQTIANHDPSTPASLFIQ